MTSKRIPEASVSTVRAWFEANAGRPRLIAIMSPTCGFCLIGHQAVRTYNSWLPEADFATLRIWIPMMKGDSPEAALLESDTTNDPRITDLYDGRHEVGRAYAEVLGFAAAAWDTYMLYPEGARWEAATPPAPSVVQHQLYPSYAPDQTSLFTPTDFWWNVVEMTGGSRQAYDDQVPALAAWLNEDRAARIGVPVPKRFVPVAQEREGS